MWKFVVLFAVLGALVSAAPQDLVGAGEGVGDAAGAAPARFDVPAPAIPSTPAPSPPARPADAASPKEPQVQELSRSEIVNADGSFNFSYELSNGVRVEESGYVKKDPQAAAVGRSLDAGADAEGEDTGEVNVAQGSYTYTAPDGTVISLSYTADENGFQPHGDHLPTPHPAIQRALAAIAAGEIDSGDEGAAQQPPALSGRSAAGAPGVVVPDAPVPASSTSSAPTSPSDAPSSSSVAPVVPAAPTGTTVSPAIIAAAQAALAAPADAPAAAAAPALAADGAVVADAEAAPAAAPAAAESQDDAPQ